MNVNELKTTGATQEEESSDKRENRKKNGCGWGNVGRSDDIWDPQARHAKENTQSRSYEISCLSQCSKPGGIAFYNPAGECFFCDAFEVRALNGRVSYLTWILSA